MHEISDTKGINEGKLEHVFLGTVHYNYVSGYHCDRDFNDTRVIAIGRLYPKSKRLIIENKNKQMFESIIVEKTTNGKVRQTKSTNQGHSTFFNCHWSRQEIVNCYDRTKNKRSLLREYPSLRNKSCNKELRVDPETGIVIVSTQAGFYPILKY